MKQIFRETLGISCLKDNLQENRTGHAMTRITALPATIFLQTWNGFEINPS